MKKILLATPIIHGEEQKYIQAEEGLSVSEDIFNRGLCLPSDIKNKEVSTNNRYKFAAIFIVFPGFFPKQIVAVIFRQFLSRKICSALYR